MLLLMSKPSYGSSLTSYAVEDGFYNGNILTNSRRLDVSNTNGIDKLALLKFDITNLKNLQDTEIISVKLKLYVDKINKNPTINVYYASNDNWTEGIYLQSHSMSLDKEDMSAQVTGSSIDLDNSKGTKWIIWDLTSMNIPEFKNFDNIVTIALEDVSKGSLNSSIRFFSKEYCSVYAPQLVIETKTTAPVTPEPSSLIFGLMSLCSMFCLRKRKNIN